MDDVEPEVRLRRNVVIDDMDAVAIASATGAGVAHDQGAAEKGLKAIVAEVDPQTLSDQLRRRAVEDALDQEAAGAGDRLGARHLTMREAALGRTRLNLVVCAVSNCGSESAQN